MKLFLKILGGILYGFVLLLMVLVSFGGLIGSIYGIVWTWTSFEADLGAKVFFTALFITGFFVALLFVYLTLDGHVNPSRSHFISPSIRPTGTREAKKPEPILGHNKPNRVTMTVSESEPD